MAFNEQLAVSVRKHLAGKTGISERNMFGGVAFLVNGNMSLGVHKNELIVRVAPEEAESALKEPGARMFDITGRPMKGWLLVGGAGLKGDALSKWVRRRLSYAASLPKKTT